METSQWNPYEIKRETQPLQEMDCLSTSWTVLHRKDTDSPGSNKYVKLKSV